VILRLLLPALALALVLAPRCLAQGAHRPPDVLDAYVRAKAILDSAVAAHGGVEALRVVQRVHVTLEGRDIHRNQSRRVATPYDSTLRRLDLWTDLPRGRLVLQQTTGYPGGFAYTTRFVSDSAKHWFVDVRNRTHSVQQYPPATQQYGNVSTIPQGYLYLAQQSSPAQRRYMGRMRLGSGAVVEAVTVATPGQGGSMLFGFDPASHHLRAVMNVSYDPITGDSPTETEFLDYRTIGGLVLPSRSTLRRAGEVTREMRYVSVTRDAGVPDSLLSPPAGSTELTAVPPGDAARQLAPGVWTIRAGNGGPVGLLVEFADHLVVVDAAPLLAPEIVTQAKSFAATKPIRFVVPTHHHDDHFGGVRHYASVGATTVTTQGNAEYFRRMVSAPASSLVPNQVPPQPGARLELLEGKRRAFTDGTRTLEIHDIGPNPHAEEMLVAWLPAEGILFHGDLIEVPASGRVERGNNAETTMQLAAFIRRQGWEVKRFVGVHGTLNSAEDFARLVAQPILAAGRP
jgi:glyoxylase-like metal-dependent hydrolase (beta-lactamase superfamily II)